MKNRFYFTVILRTERGGDLGGFLDMLRYDQALVRAWDHESPGRIVVHLKTDRMPTADRWQSFGLTIKMESI